MAIKSNKKTVEEMCTCLNCIITTTKVADGSFVYKLYPITSSTIKGEVTQRIDGNFEWINCILDTSDTSDTLVEALFNAGHCIA